MEIGQLRILVPNCSPNQGNPILREFRTLERDFRRFAQLGVFFGLLLVERFKLFKVFEEVGNHTTPCYTYPMLGSLSKASRPEDRDGNQERCFRGWGFMGGRTFEPGIEGIGGVSGSEFIRVSAD